MFGVSLGGVVFLLFLGLFVGGFSFFLCSTRYLTCLVVLEMLNVLVLGSCLLGDFSGFRVSFISLLVMFTVEIVLALVVLVRV